MSAVTAEGPKPPLIQRSYLSLPIIDIEDTSPRCNGLSVEQMTNAIAQRKFNPHTFLTSIRSGRRMMPFQKNHVIFAQGEPSDGLFFIQEGKVQLSVVSEIGKEATLGILGEADFFEKVVLLASWCACRRQPP